MQHYINKEAAKRILFSKHIYLIKEVNGAILVVYRKNYGKASTFLSKKAFERDYEELLKTGSQSISLGYNSNINNRLIPMNIKSPNAVVAISSDDVSLYVKIIKCGPRFRITWVEDLESATQWKSKKSYLWACKNNMSLEDCTFPMLVSSLIK